MKISDHIAFDFLPEDRRGIYLVGGTVRDLLTGHAPADIDLAVRGDIRRLAEAIVHRGGGRAVELGNRGFAVIRIVRPARTIDITPLNGTAIEADLAARDFTINAMAYDIHRQRVLDDAGGRDDIARKRIRMVSATAFEADPARLVRAYRLAAVLGFTIDGDTRRAITRHRQRIRGVAGERVWAELAKIFRHPHAAPIIRQMADDGLVTAIFPELAPAVGCAQNTFHQFDVFTHSLLTCQHLETLLNDVGDRFPDIKDMAADMDLSGQGYLMKYAALLHDAGKPDTRRVADDGRIRFPGHAARSADLIRPASRRLRLSRREAQTADGIIRHHIRPLFLFLSADSGIPTRRSRIRFFNRCGNLTLPILVHAMADIMAKADRLDRRGAGFIDFCHHLIVDYGRYRWRKTAAPPLISGHDLVRELGLTPAPQFRQILARVDEHRLAGELSTREDALAWVRKWLKKRGDA